MMSEQFPENGREAQDCEPEISSESELEKDSESIDSDALAVPPDRLEDATMLSGELSEIFSFGDAAPQEGESDDETTPAQAVQWSPAESKEEPDDERTPAQPARSLSGEMDPVETLPAPQNAVVEEDLFSEAWAERTPERPHTPVPYSQESESWRRQVEVPEDRLADHTIVGSGQMVPDASGVPDERLTDQTIVGRQAFDTQPPEGQSSRTGGSSPNASVSSSPAEPEPRELSSDSTRATRSAPLEATPSKRKELFKERTDSSLALRANISAPPKDSTDPTGPLVAVALQVEYWIGTSHRSVGLLTCLSNRLAFIHSNERPSANLSVRMLFRLDLGVVIELYGSIRPLSGDDFEGFVVEIVQVVQGAAEFEDFLRRGVAAAKKPPPGSPRRTSMRVQGSLPVEFEFQERLFNGFLADISETGLYLQTEGRANWSLGHPLTFLLSLVIGSQNRKIQMPGYIVRIDSPGHTKGGNQVWGLGIRFMSDFRLPPALTEPLRAALVRQYGPDTEKQNGFWNR